MLITIGALLLGLVLLWERAALPWFLAAEAVLALAGVMMARCAHSHGGMLSIDVCAHQSRLLGWNAGGKLLFTAVMLFFTISVDSALTALAVFGITTLLTLAGGRVKPHIYLSCLTLPLGFLLLGSLTVAFELLQEPAGGWGVPLFGMYLTVTESGRREAALLICRSAGAVGCLLFLSLSTPVGELIAVFRKLRIPAVVTELMYLIYRYIFILLDAAFAMQQAAESRLGYRTLRTGLRSYTRIASSLLSASFRRASENFDAMEARCYDGEIRFLARKKPFTAVQAGCFAGCAVLAAGVWALLRIGGAG